MINLQMFLTTNCRLQYLLISGLLASGRSEAVAEAEGVVEVEAEAWDAAMDLTRVENVNSTGTVAATGRK